MEYNPILRGLQWDPATSSSCHMGIPSRDSEAHMPQDKDNLAKQQVPDPSKSRANEHRLSAHGLSFENGLPRLLQGLTMRSDL
jgi:hypothetical protein